MELDRYNFKTVEEKWQHYWENKKTFKAEVIEDKKKVYCFRWNQSK